MADKMACRICLSRSKKVPEDFDRFFLTETDFVMHLEREHHIPIRGPLETYAQARRRFLLENPAAYDARTCKCEQCELKRSPRHVN